MRAAQPRTLERLYITFKYIHIVARMQAESGSLVPPRHHSVRFV